MIPPDLVLAPMVLSKPEKKYYFFMVTLIYSVLGGIFGYAIGYYFINAIQPAISYFGYNEIYNTLLSSFEVYGWLLILGSGFTPIPYKIFTIGSGALKYSLTIFIICSLISRGARFWLVSMVVGKQKDNIEYLLQSYSNKISKFILMFFALYALYSIY